MRYYIIAGEASGDLHGAHLIRALRREDAKAEFRVWGGDAMSAAAGSTPVRHIRDLAIMGFVEVVAHLRTVLGNIAFCKHDITQWHPDVVVGIDYPGFNLKIEKWAHEQGLKTVHYISPNLWAWKKSRINGMRRSLDCLLYILPFERQFFADNDMPQAVYVGHPLLDAVSEGFSSLDNSNESLPIVALLPGSRKQELRKNLPLMVDLASRHRGMYRFVVAGMSLMGKTLYEQLIPADSNIEVVYDKTYPLLASSYAAVVCSGTATLETALFDVPQVVCYRANPVSVAIARVIVSRRLRYISLVNLISDRTVVTELIQADFNPERLEQEFSLITSNELNRKRMLEQYAEMRQILGDGGASQRAAQEIKSIAR